MIALDLMPEGTRFRLLRIALGLTLFDVGREADISPPRLSEFERGRRLLPAEDVARLTAALERRTGGRDAAA